MDTRRRLRACVSHLHASTGAAAGEDDRRTAAQRLGLTTQVPARPVYLTDGTSRSVRVDLGEGEGFTIELRRSSQRAGGDRPAGMLLRALRFLGRSGPDEHALERLRSALAEPDLRQLAGLRGRAAAWMRPTIDRVLAHGANPTGEAASGRSAHRAQRVSS